ncbi:hypothetical protein Sjap_024549 [Stephania japonica]|uniref:Uncharacterized protein n=1 Tax=Stephania japonica TaxID=461633 RepID=A0AAP0EGU4_9MAGN
MHTRGRGGCGTSGELPRHHCISGGRRGRNQAMRMSGPRGIKREFEREKHREGERERRVNAYLRLTAASCVPGPVTGESQGGGEMREMEVVSVDEKRDREKRE